MTTVIVQLGDRSYPIHIDQGLLAHLPDYLKTLGITGRVGLVSSEPISRLYGPAVESALAAAGCQVSTALIPASEEAKNLATVSRLYDILLEGGLDRGCTLVALGGGVVGDITGFVAATLFRGIPFIQMPTTLLAMVDASVGGKTGVNHRLGKNLIGAFHQPRAVLIDPAVLDTLPRREITSALAEVIKYGAIADRDVVNALAGGIEGLKDLTDTPLLLEAIKRSCQIKAGIVGDDEREEYHPDQPGRRILNFGHTLGHALEASLGYGRISHGEAVAMGMVGAAYLSTEITGMAPEELDALITTIAKLELPTLPPLNEEAVLAFLPRDKKARQGKLHWVLLKAFGKPVITSQVTEAQAGKALYELQRKFG